jgi:hypothetical protein
MRWRIDSGGIAPAHNLDKAIIALQLILTAYRVEHGHTLLLRYLLHLLRPFSYGYLIIEYAGAYSNKYPRWQVI